MTDLPGVLEAWDDIKPDEGFGEKPDGTYQVVVKDAKINNAQSSGRLQVSWDLQIIAGDYKNQRIFKHEGLDSQENIARFKGSLQRLGYAEVAADELEATIQEILGSYAEVKLSTSKQGGQWCNWQRALDSDELDEDVDDSDEIPEDDSEEQEDDLPQVGDRVSVDYDGEPYEGEITEIMDDGATIKFDDGTDADHSWEEITLISSEDEEDEEESDDEDPSDDDGEVVLNFGEDDITDSHTKSISTIAKKLDIDPNDYDEWIDVFHDVSKMAGMDGEFDTPASFIKDAKSLTS